MYLNSEHVRKGVPYRSTYQGKGNEEDSREQGLSYVSRKTSRMSLGRCDHWCMVAETRQAISNFRWF